MRFRLGLVTGLAAGYYLGARAGRQRYDQINRMAARVRRTDAFQSVVDDTKAAAADAAHKARAAVEDTVDKARSAVGGHGKDSHPGAVNGLDAVNGVSSIVVAPNDPPPTSGGYSSSR